MGKVHPYMFILENKNSLKSMPPLKKKEQMSSFDIRVSTNIRERKIN